MSRVRGRRRRTKRVRRTRRNRRTSSPRNVKLASKPKKALEIREPEAILDGREGFEHKFKRFFAPENPRAEPELIVDLWIGIPGTGKSWGAELFFDASFERFPDRFSQETVLLLRERDTNIVIEKIRASKGQYRYIFAIVEDALDDQDSRDSMRGAQRRMTKMVSRLRHILSYELGEWVGGKIIIAYTVQLMAVDKRIVNMAHSIQWCIKPGHPAELETLYKLLNWRKNIELVNWFGRVTQAWHDDKSGPALLQYVTYTPIPERFAQDLNHLRKLSPKYHAWWPELPPPREESGDEVREFEMSLAEEYLGRNGPKSTIDTADFHFYIELLLQDQGLPQLSTGQERRVRFNYMGMSRILEKSAEEKPPEPTLKELRAAVTDNDRINHIIRCFEGDRLRYSDPATLGTDLGYSLAQLGEIIDPDNFYWRGRKMLGGWLTRQAPFLGSKLGCRLEHRRNREKLQRWWFCREPDQLLPTYVYCTSDTTISLEGLIKPTQV